MGFGTRSAPLITEPHSLIHFDKPDPAAARLWEATRSGGGGKLVRDAVRPVAPGADRGRRLDETARIGPLPEWLTQLSNMMRESASEEVKHLLDPRQPFEQAIINEYLPGQGIAPHTDRDCFGLGPPPRPLSGRRRRSPLPYAYFPWPNVRTTGSQMSGAVRLICHHP